ncbi:DoxX family protein [Falsiroseomonas sp. E2-1-a20]|uniref:DoxX family protein n=1 Tax=Falsiroseomonas sp. E2-1-a20 TaxID=3239300 RepID=UPI003F2A7136
MMTLSPGTDRILKLLAWPAAIWIAYELTWYQQFKLTGNEGSVYLFTILSDWLGTPGGEKPFRLFVAILEIFCAVLVLIPRTRMWGAALSLGTMSGAIFFHVVSPLGIDPYGDGGGLFKEAVFTWFMALFVLFAHRAEALAVIAALRARFLPQAA